MSTSFIKGPLQMIASSILFAGMAYFTKLASAQIPAVQIVFIRFIIGVITVLILAGFGAVSLKTNHKRLLIMRGVFGGLSVLLYFMAMATGSMTNSTILNNTYPIFATVIAALSLQERITLPVGISLLLTWAGVGFLVHPDFQQVNWADLIALLSGVLGGFAITAVRELRQKNESSWNVFFYQSLFGCLFALLFTIPVWIWPDAKGWLLLLIVGFLALGGQITLTSAYKYCSAAIGGVLNMTTMIFTAFIGIMVLGERLTVGEAAGALLIMLGSCLAVWVINRKQGEKA